MFTFSTFAKLIFLKYFKHCVAYIDVYYLAFFYPAFVGTFMYILFIWNVKPLAGMCMASLVPMCICTLVHLHETNKTGTLSQKNCSTALLRGRKKKYTENL